MTEIVVAALDEVDLVAAPIEPSWILEGDPQASVGQWSQSSDGTTLSAVWTCTAGKFRWHFEHDEIVHILDGEVLVEAAGFEPRLLRTGDAALFRAGAVAVWTVENYVRKHAIVRRPVPTPLHTLWRVLSRVKRLFKGAPAAGLSGRR